MKLGRYEVVRELGKGAMGIVYLAKDPLIGRLVALKTIRPAQHADDDETKEFQQRFIREAQAAGILNHPAIVTVHDIGQDEASGMSFIAMEYVEGNNLKEVLAQGRALSFEQIGEIIAQVAEAIDFAHSKGIVHRDVKPANIILIEGNRAKITDFGIAKIASGGANLTTTGQFLGTPNYMAPEQIKGAPVDGRTDIFSLGICFYECLTRRKPFGGDSLTSISYKIVHEPFPPLHDINPQIPEGYEEVIGQCLAKDPSKRYQRGRDLAAAIRAVIRGERPTPRPEPMLAEETIVTRDREKIPTIEVPFPEAADLSPSGTIPGQQSAPAVPRAASGAAAAAAATPSAVPQARRANVVHRTLNNVRAFPLWRRPVAPALFIGICAVLLLAVIAAFLAIKKTEAKQVTVDKRAESLSLRQRQLRVEGNDLLRRGQVSDAFVRFTELQKIAPRSPFVAMRMQQLSAIRQQEEVGKQQIAQAKQLFDEGLALYNDKKFAESVPKFEESFHLNPNVDQTAQYLKLAQQMDELERAKRQQQHQQTASNPRTQTTQPHTQTTAQQPQPVTANNAPAQLTTILNSTVADGYVMVKVGSAVVAHENLWQEGGRFFRRKQPRNVNVTSTLTPMNADIEVWVVIPSLQIQEHRTLHQNFTPGASHRLTIAFDAASKRFDYQLN